ncbi:MAG: hypothetical protein ACR2PG_00300, partial [Hyphomicrobiaceae bacterium]
LELSVSQAVIITNGSIYALTKHPIALALFLLTIFVVLRFVLSAALTKGSYPAGDVERDC